MRLFNFSLYILFFMLLPHLSWSQNEYKQPIDVITIDLPKLKETESLRIMQSGIYHIEINQMPYLDVFYSGYYNFSSPGISGKPTRVDTKKITWNIEQRRITEITDEHYYNDIKHNNSSVKIDDKQIDLQIPKAYKQHARYLIDRGLSKACLSPNKNIIGGSMYTTFYVANYRPMNFWHASYMPALWDAKTGEIIMYPQYYLYQSAMFNIPQKIGFSPNGIAFYIQGLRYVVSDMSFIVSNAFNSIGARLVYDEPYNTNEHTFIHDITLLLYNKEDDRWYEYDQFIKDIAFSSDGNFFVSSIGRSQRTEPLLYKIENGYIKNRVLPQGRNLYDTPSYMTACTFSPDDKRVYIACEDNKIYVFESGITDTKVDDWQLY